MLKWVEVDLSAIRRNLETVRSLLAPGVRLTAVVKADAYGHGAVEVAKLLEASGVKTLGVLMVDEGLLLRKAGLKSDILVLSPALAEQAPEVVRAGLTPTVDRPDLLAALDAAARTQRETVGVHVDVDLGLSRWGVAPAELGELLSELKRRRSLTLEGLSTDLGYMPGKNAVEAERKLRTFQTLARKHLGRTTGVVRHAANSGVLLDFPRWQFDGVRVGNLLYGVNPTSRPLALANAWRSVARVISVRTVAKGRSIGYGSEYIAPRKMTVAALPVGYSDGLTMEPAERLTQIKLAGTTKYWGLLRGREVPFIGRCGIAHILIDASAVPAVRVGDEVTVPLRRTAASARLPRLYKTAA